MNLINLAVAFGAGLISITSPCCLPLLPGYLGYLTGLSSALLFVVGFSMVFIALGATASVVGELLLRYRLPVAHVAGVFILAMGMVLILEGRVEVLSRGGDWSRWSAGGKVWAAPVLGAAFAITWTPCVGPVLGAILTLAGSTAALDQGIVLLAAYSLGLALPFFALSFSVVRVGAWFQRVRPLPAIMQSVAGVLLLIMGVLLITDRWLPLLSPLLTWYAQARWPPI